jgi:hypothetical protein
MSSSVQNIQTYSFAGRFKLKQQTIETNLHNLDYNNTNVQTYSFAGRFKLKQQTIETINPP